jgi:hypothetical protein
LPRDGADKLSEEPGRALDPEGRLAGRLLPLDRLLGLRTDVRDFGTLMADRGMDCPAPDMPDCIAADEPDWDPAISGSIIMPDPAAILAEPLLAEPLLAAPVRADVLPEADLADVDRDELALVDPAELVRRDVVLPDVDLPDAPADLDDVLRDVPVRDVPDLVERPDDRDDEREAGRVEPAALAAGLRVAVLRARVAAAPAGIFADDIDLAAAVSAFAAVCMAFVAVFIDRMADDMVCADAVALVAAAVILVAADVTLVAADDTPLAAAAGVAELRLEVLLLEVVRLDVLRLAELRPAVVEREREAEGRDAVDAVVLRDDLAVVLRAEVAVLLAGLEAELRVVLVVPLAVLEADVDLGRLAVPRDALRLADLRAVLAELRRVAARVVDCTGTELPPS